MNTNGADQAKEEGIIIGGNFFTQIKFTVTTLIEQKTFSKVICRRHFRHCYRSYQTAMKYDFEGN